MQYIFSGVILGEAGTAVNYLKEASIPCVSEDSYSKWEYSFTQEDHTFDLNLDIPEFSDVEYEDVILMADFFLYFINPNKPGEFDIFKDIYQILANIGRHIPGIIIFRDNTHFIQQNSLELLQEIWLNYPYEAIISNCTSLNKMEWLLNLICNSIISNSTLLNPETD